MRHVVSRLRNRTAAFTHDLVMIPVAWFGSYFFRFNFDAIPEPILIQSIKVLPIVICLQGAVFWYFGLYRGVWRFASLPDLTRILNAVVVGVALCAVAIFLLTRMQDVPRSVVPLHAVLLIVLLGGPRLAYRWFRERTQRATNARRVLIVGAGAAGETLVRELMRDPLQRYLPVAFVDDEPRFRGREIHGVRVIAKCGRIPKVVAEHQIDLVLLAIPSANSREMRRLVGYCEDASVPCRTLPNVSELEATSTSVTQLRDISIEDLLGREAVKLDWNAIGGTLAGRRVLVTGGGGSIGSELCRQIARLAPRQLVIFDHAEFNMYEIDREIRESFPAVDVVPVLGDVCDRAAVRHCMEHYRPVVVFHAAAYKHVPMLEGQIREAIKNNVIGSRNVAEESAAVEAEVMVLISTDKAVNPTNVMGASKRVAELVCQNLSPRFPGTRFITVRFGNVLDSAGSVVPLFRKQIAAGGPVTVTHPEVTRYFMTIPEACQLIMQSGAMGRGGEIFVLEMGEPIKIRYLAEQMIRLAGKAPGSEVDIIYTNLRPGEKLFEELFHKEEQLRGTNQEKILLARSRQMEWEELGRRVDAMAAGCERFDIASLEGDLGALVPEYRPGPVNDNVIPLERKSAPNAHP